MQPLVVLGARLRSQDLRHPPVCYTLDGTFFFRSNDFRRSILCSVPSLEMRKINSIIMYATKVSIFETAANLELWPTIFPHYRYIRYLERSPDRNVVVMAATRSGIPISWISEQIIDRDRLEIRFHHLKAFTKG